MWLVIVTTFIYSKHKEKKHSMIQSTYQGPNNNKFGVVKKYRKKIMWGDRGGAGNKKGGGKNQKNMEDKLISNR